MNKRIKKKLRKRFGYKWRKNPKIFYKLLNLAFKQAYPLELIKHMIYEKNPWLDLLPKYQNLYHQPVLLNTENGVSFV